MLDLNNPTYRQQRWEQLFGIYGDANRVNQEIDAEIKYQNENPQQTASDSLQNNDFMQKYLQGMITGNNGVYNQQRQVAKNDINQSFDQSQRTSQENLAQSGLSRSGLGSVVNSMISGQRGNAIAKSDANIGLLEQNAKSRAIQQLLGLDSQNLQANLGQQRMDLGQQTFNENQRQFNGQMDFKKDQTNFNFMRDLLPGLLQGGAQVGAAALSDRRLKENIKKVGKSPKGIDIVEFNYIDQPKKFRGVIAQDIKEEFPEAVLDKDGYLAVDYSKIDVDFEEI